MLNRVFLFPASTKRGPPIPGQPQLNSETTAFAETHSFAEKLSPESSLQNGLNVQKKKTQEPAALIF